MHLRRKVLDPEPELQREADRPVPHRLQVAGKTLSCYSRELLESEIAQEKQKSRKAHVQLTPYPFLVKGSLVGKITASLLTLLKPVFIYQ